MEHPSFGRDPEYGVIPSRMKTVHKKSARIKWRRVWLMAGLLAVAIAGYQIETNAASVRVSDFGACMFFISAVLLLGMLFDPLLRSKKRATRRRSTHD